MGIAYVKQRNIYHSLSENKRQLATTHTHNYRIETPSEHLSDVVHFERWPLCFQVNFIFIIALIFKKATKTEPILISLHFIFLSCVRTSLTSLYSVCQSFANAHHTPCSELAIVSIGTITYTILIHIYISICSRIHENC